MISPTKALAARYVYGYGRRSTGKQELTEAVQRERCEAWFRAAKESGQLGDDVLWGGWFYDTQSSKVDWFEREAGRELLLRLRRGDIIVFAKLDRVCRSVIDWCNGEEMLNEIGVDFECLNPPGMSSTGPYGKLMRHIVVAFAQFEREMIGERTREALNHKRRNGLPAGGDEPIGWKKEGKGRNSRFKANQKERDICLEIVRLRDEEEYPWREINVWLRKHGASHTYAGRGTDSSSGWNFMRCQAAYRSAKLGFPKLSQHAVKALFEEQGLSTSTPSPSDRASR